MNLTDPPAELPGLDAQGRVAAVPGAAVLCLPFEGDGNAGAIIFERAETFAFAGGTE